jgi:hypothetical protein
MTVAEFAWKLYFSMPPAVRQQLRILLKGGAGHTSSLFNKVIARRDARGKCRIDRAARVFCDYLAASGIGGIEGRRCLEIGTGYVGSSPVVMWLLGVGSVTSVDLNRLLVPAALKESVLSVEKAELHDILKKHARSEEALRGRIDQVYAWAGSGREDLPDWFSYLAPFDLLTRDPPHAFDLVYSASTLEHIPRSLVSQFVGKTASISTDGGVGLHFIDLKDHFDSEVNPLGFLALRDDDYSDDVNADSRGNRIRGPEWLDIFSKSGLTAEIVMSSRALRSQLPDSLAIPFKGMDVQDLLLTSVVVRACKKP